jgi:hypothetical protein
MTRFIKRSHLPIIIAPLLLFALIIFSGKALVWGTVSTQFIPWWDYAWDTFLQGRIPLWNPWVGMGAPLVANYQSALFYPPYWFLLIIYAIAGVKWMSWSVTIVVVFHLVLSGLGTAKLLEELEQGELAQIAAGLAYSLSGYLVARSSFLSINAAAAWLPWILLYSLKVVRGKKGAFWSLILVMAFQLLAGHAQTTWYSILLGGIWVLFFVINNYQGKDKIGLGWRAISKYISAGLLAAGLSAIQLIPTAEYLLQSQRSGEYGYAEAMTYSFWPWRFLTLIVPNLFGNPAAGNYWGYGNYWEDAVYVGLLPLLIALGVVARSVLNRSKNGQSSKSKNLVIFLGVIVGVSFLLALGDNTFLFPFLYKNIPTFGSFQAPTRFSLWAEISLAILAGIGIDQLVPAEGRRKYWMRLAAAGCVAVIGGAVIGWKFLSGVEKTFFIPIGLAGLFGLGTTLLILSKPAGSDRNQDKIWSGLLVLLIAVDLLIAGWGLNPGVGIGFYGVGQEERVSSRIFMDQDLEYDLKFNKYFRFESFRPEVPWNDMHQDLIPNLPMLIRLEMVNNFDPLVPAQFKKWLAEFNHLEPGSQGQMAALMNIGQIFYQSGDFVESIEIIADDEYGEVWIAERIDINDDEEKILENIIQSREVLERRVIITSSPTVLDANCQSRGIGEAHVNLKRPGYININTNLSENSWVFWSQSWYPGWIAVIDGVKKVEVEKANYLFQAACIPAGEHVVEFIYRPLSFTAGWVISALTASLLAAAWMIQNRKGTDQSVLSRISR